MSEGGGEYAATERKNKSSYRFQSKFFTVETTTNFFTQTYRGNAINKYFTGVENVFSRQIVV